MATISGPFDVRPLTNIKIRGRRQRAAARRLLDVHLAGEQHQHPRKNSKALFHTPSQPDNPPIRVVCISDTHNKEPALPPGDLLIHAGDLTENGSFDEVQAGLTWLSAQPFRHKILVAGNHDVLLDEAFLEQYPERRYGDTRTKQDLDWGSVIYLQDTSVTLEFPHPGGDTTKGGVENDSAPPPRTLTVYGSPWTPRYGISAFQYEPIKHQHWETRLGSLSTPPDVVVTHGPPRLHLDVANGQSRGCPLLAEQIRKLRPRLVVFGHIHVGHGREDHIVLDRVRGIYEDVMNGWDAGWDAVLLMACLVAWGRVVGLVRALLGINIMRTSRTPVDRSKGPSRTTTFANAAMVGGPKNDLVHEPVVVELYE